MKQIITMLLIITILLVGLGSSQLEAKPVIDKTKTVTELNKTTLNKESADKIASFYSLRIKEKPISYVTDGISVIITLNNTNNRIITKKDRFDTLLIESE